MIITTSCWIVTILPEVLIKRFRRKEVVTQQREERNGKEIDKVGHTIVETFSVTCSQGLPCLLLSLSQRNCRERKEREREIEAMCLTLRSAPST